MSATIKIVIKVKDLPSNRFKANSFCDLVLSKLSQKGITGVLYYHITKQVVTQISQYLSPPTRVENFLEKWNKIPEAETYPSLGNYVPERYVKHEDSQGSTVYYVDRDAIYKDLVEKDAEFVLRIPLPPRPVNFHLNP